MNARIEQQPETASGSGWLLFAAIVLGVAGFMRIFDAIWAFRYDGVLPDQFDGALFGTDLSSYAWTYLIVGAILVLSSVAVMSRSQFARWIGIIAAAIGTISAIWWMPFYPVWSLTYVLLGVLVIYALAAHGSREPAVQT